MAEVFLAVIEGSGQFRKLIALKILRSQFAEDPEGREMFLNEARLAARLSHQNVVQSYEVGEEDGRHFIAMEYLDGQPYSRILHRSRTGEHPPMPLAMSLRIVAEALAGLHYAHESKDFDGTPLHLVHRDVSPHNVFITYEGVVKVLDFGIAKAVGGSAETRTGVLKGKVAYMAPEQILDKPLDCRVDVYAAGVMLWEVIAGRRVWKGVSDIGILNKVATEGIPALSTVIADVDPELERITMKAVAPNRDERYANAADFQAALESHLEELTEKSSTRAIGKFVAETFKDMRAETQRLIEEQVSRARSVPPGANMDPISLPNPSMTGSNPLFGGTLISGPQSQSSSNISVLGAPPANPRRGAALMIGALGVAALAVGVWFATRTPASSPPSTVTQANAATAQPAAPSAKASTAVAAVAQTVTFKIDTTPKDAKVYVDSELLTGSPAEKRFPKDGAIHEVRVEADGYSSHSDKVSADSDHTLMIPLEKEKVAAKWIPGKPKPSPPAPSSTTPPVVTAAPPPPPVVTAQPPPTTKKPLRPIDTDNPFK